MPRLQAPQYTWVCQYCGLGSPGGTLHCANCGFPAHTSAFELERAKRLGSVQEFLKDRELQRHDWRRKPLPKKILIVATLPVFTTGVVLLQVAAGLTSMVLGAAIMGAAVLLLWLSN